MILTFIFSGLHSKVYSASLETLKQLLISEKIKEISSLLKSEGVPPPK